MLLLFFIRLLENVLFQYKRMNRNITDVTAYVLSTMNYLDYVSFILTVEYNDSSFYC